MLTKIKIAIVAVMAGTIFILKAMLGREKAEKKLEEEYRKQADAENDLHAQTAQAVKAINEIHREEKIDVDESLEKNDRSQLDNNWS